MYSLRSYLLTLILAIIASTIPTIVEASNYYPPRIKQSIATRVGGYIPPRVESIYGYSRGYFPPRIQQLCNDNFIGKDWNKSQRYEKRCRVLWMAWSEEMKYTLPY